jgi:hypothetical protein
MFKHFKEKLAHANPDALLLDGFEDALIGVGYRPCSGAIALYSYSKCVDVLVGRAGMDVEGAIDFIDFNVACAFVGENGPILVDLNGSD